MKNFKKALAVFALMAVSVIAQPSNAGDKLEKILDVAAHVLDGRDGHHDRGGYGRGGYDHDGYDDRWLCQTSSRGYVFRAEGRSYDEANYNAVNMCMRHPYGTNSECRYQVSCQQLGGNGGGGGNYPYPQPAPRMYNCQTFGGGQWVSARHQNLQQAQRRAIRQCQANPYSRPPECERNLRCGY